MIFKTMMEQNNNFNFFYGGYSAAFHHEYLVLHYHHVFTDCPLQQLYTHFDQLLLGRNDYYDALLRHEESYYLIHFFDDLDSFENLRKNLVSKLFFNQELYLFDLRTSNYKLISDLTHKNNIIPIHQDISTNSLLETLLFKILTQKKILGITGEMIDKSQKSFFLFRVIFEELVHHKILYQGFEALLEFDLLGDYIPELLTLKGISHDKDFHPEGDAFEHVMECLKYFESKNILLAWAILLHDIGKAHTKSYQKHKFYNHGEIGGKLAKTILKRFQYQQKFISDVVFLVEHHMTPLMIPKMSEKEKISFISHPLSDELLQIFKYDIMGSHKNMKFYNQIKTALWKDDIRIPKSIH